MNTDQLVRYHRELVQLHASLAARDLQAARFSEAATECHRAHQNRLIVEVLEAVASNG